MARERYIIAKQLMQGERDVIVKQLMQGERGGALLDWIRRKKC